MEKPLTAARQIGYHSTDLKRRGPRMLTNEALRDIVGRLASRPGHENVRALVRDLLIQGLGAAASDVELEKAVPEVRGRIDGLLGRTVFEFKTNLRTELRDAEAQLTRYLQDRERQTGERYVGIATDGSVFRAYELRGGALGSLGAECTPSADAPRLLLLWLDSYVSLDHERAPEPDAIREQLGRGSPTYARARNLLQAAWAEVGDTPDVALKRRLWADLLARVYGSSIAEDALFFQHTYLTIVAKTMAASVLGVSPPEPAGLLSGRPFQQAGIYGAVESDFFDWVLDATGHDDLIRRIERQVSRFKLRDVQHDVLKVLYESLIDPETRHDLGEYYTPDWLAQLVCERAIERPLEQRVVDPACGSGTFLFHAVRRLLAAAREAGMPATAAVELACRNVLGIDVHPVAVIIARVTYLLALGQELLRQRTDAISVPVYLGDSLQWNVQETIAQREVIIGAVEGKVLHFPFSVTRDPALFDAVLAQMLRDAEAEAPPQAFGAWLARTAADPSDYDALVRTYEDLRYLLQHDLNRIWGYVARNLSRPLWLADAPQHADVLIGNPPWLSYRFMDGATQARFKQECELRGIWAGGRFATHQDLSAYFFARCTELYLKGGGLIAFVMPYAALSRGQFAGFRRGFFARGRTAQPFAVVRFEEAWAFDEDVQPLFPVPACVLFGRRTDAGPLPATVRAYRGTLPRRDAALAEALHHLTFGEAPWPSEARATRADTAFSYGSVFRDGATLYPRMLCLVERVTVGQLGANPAAPAVRSHRSNQEKAPWKVLPPLTGVVEAQFLRHVYLGESLLPYRLLRPLEAVIPWSLDTTGLLDAAGAQAAGYPHLAAWLREAERLWDTHGPGSMTFRQQLDYYGKLSVQLPPAPLRVVYAASGTVLAAAIVEASPAVCEHALYWAAVATRPEAQYLCAVLNSETLRAHIEHLQARGQWGARHFDKYVFRAPIPRFDPRTALHAGLAAAAARAEAVAATVPLKEGEHFVRARGRIRQALADDGVAGEIDGLVARLFAG